MFNINRTLKKGVRYPDKELLCDYQDLHFADLVSTPAVRAMSGIDNTIELGDSGYWYMITFDLSLIGQSRKENSWNSVINLHRKLKLHFKNVKKIQGFLSVFFGRQKEKWSKIFCCSVNFCEIGKELSWFFSLLICPQNTSKNYYVILTTRRVSEIWKKNTLEISY